MSTSKYPIGDDLAFESGGKAAIERLVEAYGFSTRQALADHLNVSKSTLANRYLRDTFPGDWIIRCSLETGVSLAWLATGQGYKTKDNATTSLTALKLTDGELLDSGFIAFDKSFIPNNLRKPMSVIDKMRTFIIDMDFNEITDGEWLVEIEGKKSIRHLTRIPIGKVKVASSESNFVCELNDIKVLAKCCSVFIKDI